jgi:chromosome partitioning protein
MLITTAGQKGGPGKTTAAVNLAAWRARQGRRVLLVDADPHSKSAGVWAGLRLRNGYTPAVACVNLYGGMLVEQIRQLGPEYEDVVIDVGGADSEELRAALAYADKAVVPCIVSGFDLRTMRALDELVHLAGGMNPKLRALVVLNSASTHPKDREADEAREALQHLKRLHLLPGKLSHRTAFRACAKAGASVFDLDDTKARAEVEALAAEVWA